MDWMRRRRWTYEGGHEALLASIALSAHVQPPMGLTHKHLPRRVSSALLLDDGSGEKDSPWVPGGREHVDVVEAVVDDEVPEEGGDERDVRTVDHPMPPN